MKKCEIRWLFSLLTGKTTGESFLYLRFDSPLFQGESLADFSFFGFSQTFHSSFNQEGKNNFLPLNMIFAKG